MTRLRRALRLGGLSAAVLVVLLVTFAAGRWSSTDSDDSGTSKKAPTDNAPETTTRQEAAEPEPALNESALDGSVAELFGLDTVIGSVESRGEVLVALGCDEPDDPASIDSSTLVVGLAAKTSDEWEVESRRQLYSLTFGCCEGEVIDGPTSGTHAVLANCLIGGSDGVSSVVVAGGDGSLETNGLLLNVSCGRTGVRPIPNGIRLTSSDPGAGWNQPSPDHPSFDLTWREDWRFSQDDYDLYEWFCDENSDAWVDGYITHPMVPESAEPTDSELGEVMVLGPVVFVSMGPKCQALNDAWELKAYSDRPNRSPAWDGDPSPIATALGLSPPDGLEDWLWDCHDDRGQPPGA